MIRPTQKRIPTYSVFPQVALHLQNMLQSEIFFVDLQKDPEDIPIVFLDDLWSCNLLSVKASLMFNLLLRVLDDCSI